MAWWKCIPCTREGKSGWHELAEYSVSTRCPVCATYMQGPFPEAIDAHVLGLMPTAPRRPSIEQINLFFERNYGPKGPVDAHTVNFQMLNDNLVIWRKEFVERVRTLKNSISEEQALGLWELMVECFVEKKIDKAYAFLQRAKALGLKPLEAESPRVFWSGAESRKKAYEVSQPPPEATALEKTDIGQLLDKLSLFKAVPWELSTLLWALVSRYFGMGASGDIHVYMDGGFALGNVFWNDELPVLRLMQRYGAVRSILIHIWHTEDLRWMPEFSIDSDQLLLVFDKSRRIPAPTIDNPQQTRSFRFEKPYRLANFRRLFERALQQPDRLHPLVLYNFRKETGVYARLIRKASGVDILLFEYESEHRKLIRVVAANSQDAIGRMTSIEAFMMANYTAYVQIPFELICLPEAFIDGSGHGGKILAVNFNPATGWRYRHALIARFPESEGWGLLAKVHRLLPTLALKYATGGMDLPKSRRLLGELFDGKIGESSDLGHRLQCLRMCFGGPTASANLHPAKL